MSLPRCCGMAGSTRVMRVSGEEELGGRGAWTPDLDLGLVGVVEVELQGGLTHAHAHTHKHSDSESKARRLERSASASHLQHPHLHAHSHAAIATRHKRAYCGPQPQATGQAQTQSPRKSTSHHHQPPGHQIQQRTLYSVRVRVTQPEPPELLREHRADRVTRVTCDTW